MNIRFIFPILLFSLSLFSQDGIYSPLTAIIPPSPSAYDLGKYGQIPVGIATGTAQVDIPLYTYKTANLSVPIYLNYASNGSKVNQVEAHVGLGWSLNTGGVITRIVRGLPDEKRRGIINDDHCSSHEFVDYVEKNFKNNDTQPDLYMYNFMGRTGQFVFNNSGEPVLVPYNGLKIEKTEQGFIGGHFTITTEDGVKYEFKATESTTVESVVAPSAEVTAWNLTKITHPKGDEINFTYEPDTYFYIANKQTSIKILLDYPGRLCPGTQSPVAPEMQSHQEEMHLSISADIISKISSNNPEAGTVVFNHIAHPDPKLLPRHLLVKGLKVFNKNNTLIESANFNYLFTNAKRVFLEEVSFKDPQKRYLMEYNRPKEFSARLENHEDLWGYNNTYSTSTFPDPIIHKELYGLRELPKRIRDFISITGGSGNKNTNISATYGMLKKITYPTNGYNLFEFEPNTIWGAVTTPLAFQTARIYLTENVSGNESTNTTIFTNTHDIETKIDANFTFRGYETEHGNFPIGVYEVTSVLEALTSVTSSYTSYLRLTASEHNKKQEQTVRLAPNTQYKITTTFTYGRGRDASAKVNLRYANGGGVTTEQNIPYNGVRIKKITAHDTDNQITDYKRYYYGSGSEDRSTANKGIKHNFVEYTTVLTPCQGQLILYSPVKNNFMTIYANSIYPLYNIQGNGNMTYSKVTVSHGGESFEQGGEENYFTTSSDSEPETCINSYYSFSPWTNSSWNNGLIQKKNILNSEKKTIQDIEYTYKNDTRKFQKVSGVHLKQNYQRMIRYEDIPDYLGILRPNPRNIEHLNIARYSTNSYWFYLASEKNTIYNSAGKSLTTTTNYLYENPTHAQKTQVETIDASGNTTTTKIFYPDDVTSNASLENPVLNTTEYQAINSLKKNNLHQIATPIQTQTKKNNQNTNTQRTTYKNFNNLILPEKIASKKGNANSLENRLIYKKYDSKGNPIELELPGGLSIVFIWGHNQSLPIAKIENTTLANLLTQLGINEQQLANLNENSMTSIDNLRRTFTEAHIYTYTYQPLIGMRTQTDPRGQKTTYQYDEFNRLKDILDSHQNHLINYEYNYIK